MLLNWLKKDLAKDFAAMKAIGAELTRGKMSLRSTALPLAAAGTALSVFGEVLAAAGGTSPNDEADVPFYDQGGLNHWNVRQWD